MVEEKDKEEDKKNDKGIVEKWKTDVEKYLEKNPRIDDIFMERFYGKGVQARFLSKNVEDLEDAMFMNGLAGIDCSNVDFSKLSVENYKKIPFDTETKFPPDIEPIFKAILEKGKKFGFGLEELIQEGKLSGEGINIAVVDQSFYIDSIDKNDINIVIAETGGDHYHGKIVTSLLASKSCGVAKGANVFFYEKPEKNVELGSVFEKIVQYNENCKNDSDRITVLSGSWRVPTSVFEKWSEILRNSGCELVCQNNFIENFTEISGGDVLLEMTEEEKAGFSEPMREMLDNVDLDTLVKIPINRTYHQFGLDDGFKYQAFYSNSWGIPQIAGLFALYKEKDKTLNFEEFCDMCRESALEKGIINPKGIYELIEKKQEKMFQDSIDTIEGKIIGENPLGIMDQIKGVVMFTRQGEIEGVRIPEKTNEKNIKGEEEIIE